MTDPSVVYDSFLSKILDDEWGDWTEEELKADLEKLLLAALPWFKFPRTPLTMENGQFVNDLSFQEIEIIATYMKCEWLNRSILTWEHIKPLYEERDFSQANLVSKLSAALAAERKNAKQLESNYYRSVNYKPFSYRQLGAQE